jgi:GR25 family glycosyltransferase involved in LPS biosynthesis
MVENIFIIHYKKLIERRNYLSNKFKDKDLIFIDEYDRDTIDNNIVRKYYNNNKFLWEERTSSVYREKYTYRDLKMSEICNYLSHIKALELIIENNFTNALILEDDVILKENFFEEFDKIFMDTPTDFDIIFLGSSYTVDILENVGIDTSNPIVIVSDKRVYKKYNHPKTRTVDSYIITNECAKKLKEEIKEIALP